ncbi:hypothetical protein BCR39DRAFT_519447 [Naematelia encephala]|uniref:Uncharacterized protein n=1 Tax=Naematelia encephala TaxID=71784 RepID=A0A1Y2BEU6_9TREE|nr:hypothetical protein BCR39DRAFT_519447 [Naematelia encephala]
MAHKLPKKIDLRPKKYHGFQFLLFLLGCLLPPLAVAVRFGIGKDFFINTFLCICGYFPCHFHNFYIQNIRNNTNRARTPKWALKAGLINNSDNERRLKKSQWSKRFDERNNQSTLANQPLEEGEEGENYVPVSEEDRQAQEHRRREGLWDNNDEEYYNEDRAINQERWHYPANFEGTVGDGRSRGKKANAVNGDRWERSRASRSSSMSSGTYPPAAATDADVPEWGKDYGSKRRSTKNKNAAASAGGQGGWAGGGGYVKDVQRDDAWGGSKTPTPANGNGNAPKAGRQQSQSENIFEHEF